MKNLPVFTLDDYEQQFQDRHLLHGAIEKWSREKPTSIALIDAECNRPVSWKEFDRLTRTLAMLLVQRGFAKGDFFASLLPLTSEHIFLEYACLRIGVVFVPLDLKLGAAELIQSLDVVRPSGFAFMKVPGIPDAAAFCTKLKSQFPLKMVVQFGTAECNDGVVPASVLLGEAARCLLKPEPTELAWMRNAYEEAAARVCPDDGALVIFTTGSTGSPKPALLSHRNISCQAMGLSNVLLRSSGVGLVTLVNLPPSHVGCQGEMLMSTIFDGGCAVLLSTFDPLRSLRAIEAYRVTAIGQIPAMFQYEWRLKEFESFDFSSVEFAAYGGQQVSPAFITKMATMARNVGTGLALTEAAGVCTYIRRPRELASECATSLGFDMPVYPMTIRQAMQPDGAAGSELLNGELGCVCFRGPQTFLGYVNDAGATAATISSDQYLYTGDMGYMDKTGLHLSGRAKWVIKPSGYQVFPGDVENHFCTLEGVALCAVVGVPHPIISEAIVAFVETSPGCEVPLSQLTRHARKLASYRRPYHYVMLKPGQMPLNRTAKTDYTALRERARQELDTSRKSARLVPSSR